MAKCSYHPDVDTEMRCAQCEKPICPKEMVLTPVGYKCPDCARPEKGQYRLVKPKQLLRAILVGIGVGVVGGIIVAVVPFFGFIAGILWGSATAEAVRRASGGHRGTTVGLVAVASIGLGWLVSLAVGGMSFIAAIVAVVTVLVQLAVIERR